MTLESEIERQKLAQLLGCSPESLSYLDAAPAAGLRELRHQAVDRLFDADHAALARMAAAARVVPVALLARMAEHVFGPLLCARIASLLDTGRAAEVALRLSPGFLARTASELDPRRATDLISRLPAERLVTVAGELDRRGEHVTMGRFVGHLPEGALEECVTVLSPGGLVRTAFVLDDKDRIEDIFRMLGAARRAEIVAAVEQEGLWTEAVELLRHLDPERRRELGRLTAERPGDGPAQIAAAAERLGVSDQIADFFA